MKFSNVARLVAALGLAACSSSTSTSTFGTSGAPSEAGDIAPAKVDVARSAQTRNMDPQLSESERDILSSSQVGFAVDLYHAVRATEPANEDILLSPHSISIALAMQYAGARSETAAEMKKALRFDLPDERLHTGFAYLDLALASRGKGAKGKDGKPFRLNVANSIWGQKGSPLEMPFLDTLAIHYGAGLNLVDFVADTERSRLAINGWVEERTESRIKELLRKGIVDESTRMVLVNAVYFNAAWASAFKPDATTTAPFFRMDGSTVDVPMMNATERRPYARGDGYDAVEMAYEGDELSMLVIAPFKGRFAEFESSLSGPKVLDILGRLRSTPVHLSFPKLKIEQGFGLNGALQALGMERAFGASADFNGISTDDSLYIGAVVHKTFMEISEAGTEAAAATGVVVQNASATSPAEMNVDRPFLLAIVDRPTKTLLFLGRVLEPKL